MLITTGFRPLIGVNFCKQSPADGFDTEPTVSVPLSGLVSVNGKKMRSMSSLEGFRPLIGVNFCKHEEDSIFPAFFKGFRPLIGVNFCKQFSQLWRGGLSWMFPSPYRG